ncbi:MAG: 4Fe-4S dicluster domain-containing protein [Candidatus Riflebacteria bacterium]|nr:4Fe-4S dicluster domain-containing protein [Candidatus Riflebacteria bacterium]
MITIGSKKSKIIPEILKRSRVNVFECYQCGKCVASCAVSKSMDLTPRRMFQMLKLGQDKEVLEANSTWFCLTCSACSSRCPRKIDIPKAMETIRHIAMENNIVISSRSARIIKKFHEIFLSMVFIYGRLFELRFMTEFNIRTFNFFKDILLAPKVLLRGKLAFRPAKIAGINELNNISDASKVVKHEKFEKSERAEKVGNVEVAENVKSGVKQ